MASATSATFGPWTRNVSATCSSDVLGHTPVHERPGRAFALLPPSVRREGRHGPGEGRNGPACASIARPSCPGCCRYQRAVISTSRSTPAISSSSSAGSRDPTSASISSQRSTAPVTSRAIRYARHVGRFRARLGHDARHERDALRVHDVVRHQHRDQLAAQGVLVQHRAEPLHDLRREIGAQITLEVGRVRERGREQRVREALLRVGEEHGELGSRHPPGRPAPLGHVLGVGSASRSRSRTSCVSRPTIRSSYASMWFGDTTASCERIWAWRKLSYST